MKKVIKLFSLLIIAGNLTVNAAKINVQSTPGTPNTGLLLNSSSVGLPDGTEIGIGIFNSGFDFNTIFSFSSIDNLAANANFTLIGTKSTVNLGGNGITGGFGATTGNFTGNFPATDKFHLVATLNGEWGAFQNSGVVVPRDDSPIGATLNVQFNAFNVASVGTLIDAGSGLNDGKLAAIPEPSTYLLLAIGLGSIYLVSRKK